MDKTTKTRVGALYNDRIGNVSKREELRTKLKAEIDVAQWDWLKPHADQDRLIVVDQELDLLEVGVLVADNDLKTVEDWMKRDLLTKPTSVQLRAFEADGQRAFRCLIVQPWVFIQAQSN